MDVGADGSDADQVNTVTSRVGERIDRFRELLRKYLGEDSGELRDVNRPGDSAVIIGVSNAWGDLDQQG